MRADAPQLPFFVYGTLLPGEADIVSAQNNRARIQDLYLLDETAYRGRIENAPAPPFGP